MVVSRPASKIAPQLIMSGISPSRHIDSVTSHLPNSISLNPTSYFNEATSSGGCSRLSANLNACDNESLDADSANQSSSMEDHQCETESNVGSSCSRGSSNEIEESCLLGIDCNEKTTVGLVLKVLADTAIRLDGDG